MVTATICNKKNQTGFTLVEALVAITILAFGLMAAAAMQGVAIDKNSIANNNSVASMLTMQVAEDILSYSITDPTNPYNGPVTNATYTFYDENTNTYTTSLTIPGSGTYQAVYTIDTNQAGLGAGAIPLTGTSTVQVTVNRITNIGTSGQNLNGSYPVSTYTTFKRVQ
ncbi:MAG TPA: prepilin-type N-terminal cleavage/methylation domain-containing protein [Nitrospirota bacterium]|nr:prepilin-type N-terminal cleavage/methylation domain-containing protein [Nitrospirota bacterium]